jgi:polyhydroxyalkanoate synthase subunit PhaC
MALICFRRGLPMSAKPPQPYAIPNAFGLPNPFGMSPGMFGTMVPSLPVDVSSYMVANPDLFLRNMLTLVQENGQIVSTMVDRGDLTKPTPVSADDMQEQARLWGEITQHWMADPARLAEHNGALMRQYMELWQATAQKLAGQNAAPVVTPDKGDNRFKDEEWGTNAYFDFWKQAYLITARWMTDTLTKTEGLDEGTRHRADFLIRQMVAAMSPSNNPMLNPEVIRATMTSSGDNLVAGTKNFSTDLKQSGDMLKIAQTDTSAFEIGKNLATTPGKVVFQNEIIQLIQYAPTTEKVHEIPFVLVPPWINKFYILDLGPQKSFIKYIVDQGYTVFVVSWVNPDARLGHKSFEDYMHEGLLAAAEAAKKECGTKRVNILGYCIGGTLLATTLAYLAGRNEELFNSASFLVAQVDFQKAGDLKLFIDEQQLKTIEALMAKDGYLDGGRMATVFNLLRPKDLLWPYIVNNYMLGKQPAAFDLLYWNQDSTRMPPANHAFYLREFYHQNKLAEGKMVMGNVKLDLGRVRLPIFHLATREDHISPPRSVFTGAKLFGGPVEFVLAGSGHIAGVVSPPGKTKYPYWTNNKPLSHPQCATLDDWLKGAEEVNDSWWPHWIKWLAQYSGDMVRARKPGCKLGVIEDAPGSYVKAKA